MDNSYFSVEQLSCFKEDLALKERPSRLLVQNYEGDRSCGSHLYGEGAIRGPFNENSHRGLCSILSMSFHFQLCYDVSILLPDSTLHNKAEMKSLLCCSACKRI